MNRNKFTIGVIGTQNTGKSTFIKDIDEHYNGTSTELHQVGTDYRKKIAEKGLSINRNGNLECQKVIMETLLEQLDIISKSTDGNYIMDRTPIDAYVYTFYLYVYKPELGITAEDMDEMFEMVRSSVSKYDKLIYFDLDKCGNVKVVDDRFRDTDIEYRKKIDEIFRMVLRSLRNELEGRLVSDICGDRKERVDGFINEIGGLLVWRRFPHVTDYV